jgi:hypothetical protein
MSVKSSQLKVKFLAQVNGSQILSQQKSTQTQGKMQKKKYFDWEIPGNMTKSGKVSGNSVKVK